jgi:hypothetical protein
MTMIFGLVLGACGDDGSKASADTVRDTTAGDTAETAQDAPESLDTRGDDTAPDSAGETSPDTADTADTADAPARVDAACSEQGYDDCFHNGDCEAAERCEDMSASDLQIPCCVPGARGTGEAGVPCADENDCASALCISTNDGPFLCSKVCQGDGDCPPAAARCSAIGACVPAP